PRARAPHRVAPDDRTHGLLARARAAVPGVRSLPGRDAGSLRRRRALERAPRPRARRGLGPSRQRVPDREPVLLRPAHLLGTAFPGGRTLPRRESIASRAGFARLAISCQEVSRSGYATVDWRGE